MSLGDSIAEVDIGRCHRELQRGAIGVGLLLAIVCVAVSWGEHGHAAQGISLLVGLAVSGLLWGILAGLRRFQMFAAQMCEIGRELERKAEADLASAE
jgi:hypothetical protein